VAIDQKALVEAFPSSFLGMMIKEPALLAARRGDRSDTFFKYLATTGTLESLIEHCLPGRQLARALSSVVNHDDRAAVVCALSALCVAVSDFVAVGDDDGWIISRIDAQPHADHGPSRRTEHGVEGESAE
jgi:hypothetical protein